MIPILEGDGIIMASVGTLPYTKDFTKMVWGQHQEFPSHVIDQFRQASVTSIRMSGSISSAKQRRTASPPGLPPGAGARPSPPSTRPFRPVAQKPSGRLGGRPHPAPAASSSYLLKWPRRKSLASLWRSTMVSRWSWILSSGRTTAEYVAVPLQNKTIFDEPR